MTRVLLIGADCLGPEVLDPPTAAAMPALNALAADGLSGPLESTLPPITVPAWSSMLTGRDPGELGVYGFRNRRTYDYGDLVTATSRSVRFRRLWDRLGAEGRPSVVVGVPQTSPPPPVEGMLVCGFEGPLTADGRFTTPPELADEVREVVGTYVFDVPEYRSAPLERVRDEVARMTRQRFALLRHFLRERPWEFAMVHEIGPDRMHHCFWRFHDPAHPRYERAPESDAILDYYRLLDEEIEAVLDLADDAVVLAASDHGATAMHGGVCVNELLIEAGLLRLRRRPDEPTRLTPEAVDWSRTRAWAEGGYYARVFLNLAGREPAGIVRPQERAGVVEALRSLLSEIDLGDGRVLANRVAEPAELYRRVRGLPPDLLVFFEGDAWRSLGTVGLGRRWIAGNDTGVDEANHARLGFYALRAPGVPRGTRRPASILDVAPTLIRLLGLEPDADLAGRDLLGVQEVVAA
jgi:predicted AlkP superfamily phosphohydrolase/phosphomutase